MVFLSAYYDCVRKYLPAYKNKKNLNSALYWIEIFWSIHEDIAGAHKSMNNLGDHGATANLCRHCEYFGDKE